MRLRSLLLLVAAIAALWHPTTGASASLCSYMASYPSATGRYAYLLATATPDSVSALPDSVYGYSMRAVRSQVMRVHDIAGYQASAIRDGLRASGGTAAFVRYRIGPSCAPSPARDGMFDEEGVSGLYVGRPRPADRWVDGQPTFDVFRAQHFPLPQRFSGPSGHVVVTRMDTTPTMSSNEMFSMYRTLWAESISVGDRSVAQRISRWLQENPTAARKQPTNEVVTSMLYGIIEAQINTTEIPFGGTYFVSVLVPGFDSIGYYGQTYRRSRMWISDETRDSASGVRVDLRARSFALDLTTAPTLKGFERPSVQINNCSPIPFVFLALPVTRHADSTWRTETFPSGFLACAPEGSPLHAMTLPRVRPPVNLGEMPIVFREHGDGRITFEGQTLRDGKISVHVRGERVSTTVWP